MAEKELGYIELEWTCKHCGTKNPGMNRTCSNCGVPLSQEDKFELPDQQELITDKEKLEEAKKGPSIRCPYCNTFNPAGTAVCKQCGGDIQAGLARQSGEVLGAHETGAVPDRPCPFCNQPVKANASRCPHCGGSLVQTAGPVAAPAASPKPRKFPIWLIFAGVFLGISFCGCVIGFIALNNRTHEVKASVSEMHWQLAIEILEKQPVNKSAWSEDVPSLAQDVSCEDKYKETSNNPVPNATEVCGTPYVVDQGSGAGKVVQDCEYRVYASYCNFTVMDWAVVDHMAAQGDDNNPQWPTVILQSGQKEGDRSENYQVIFDAGGKTYSYTPADESEFRQFDTGTSWVLAVNTFGGIKSVSRK